MSIEEPPQEMERPPAAPPRIRRVSWVWAVVLPALLGAGILFLFDPSLYALYPSCAFKKVTGYDCPGCGGLRAGHQLLHGDVGEAFRLNAMVVIGIPVLLFLALRAWLRRADPGRARKPGRLIWPWVVVGVILLFGLIRNLAIWPFGITPM